MMELLLRAIKPTFPIAQAENNRTPGASQRRNEMLAPCVRARCQDVWGGDVNGERSRGREREREREREKWRKRFYTLWTELVASILSPKRLGSERLRTYTVPFEVPTASCCSVALNTKHETAERSEDGGIAMRMRSRATAAGCPGSGSRPASISGFVCWRENR